MKVYCRQCGSGTTYVSQKPKFCSQCGQSFLSSSAKTKPAPVRAAPTVIERHTSNLGFEREEESESGFSSMSGLECDIQKAPNVKTTLGDIAGTSEEDAQVIERPKAYARKRVSKKQVLADFQAEAGQSRESSEI